jgi:hypothetical protein
MESNYKSISYLTKKENLIQYLSESNLQFNQRIQYIRLLEKANVNWKEALRLSKVWYCIKFKNCKYAPELYYKVISYEKIK